MLRFQRDRRRARCPSAVQSRPNAGAHAISRRAPSAGRRAATGASPLGAALRPRGTRGGCDPVNRTIAPASSAARQVIAAHWLPIGSLLRPIGSHWLKKRLFAALWNQKKTGKSISLKTFDFKDLIKRSGQKKSARGGKPGYRRIIAVNETPYPKPNALYRDNACSSAPQWLNAWREQARFISALPNLIIGRDRENFAETLSLIVLDPSVPFLRSFDDPMAAALMSD